MGQKESNCFSLDERGQKLAAERDSGCFQLYLKRGQHYRRSETHSYRCWQIQSEDLLDEICVQKWSSQNTLSDLLNRRMPHYNSKAVLKQLIISRVHGASKISTGILLVLWSRGRYKLDYCIQNIWTIKLVPEGEKCVQRVWRVWSSTELDRILLLLRVRSWEGLVAGS